MGVAVGAGVGVEVGARVGAGAGVAVGGTVLKGGCALGAGVGVKAGMGVGATTGAAVHPVAASKTNTKIELFTICSPIYPHSFGNGEAPDHEGHESSECPHLRCGTGGAKMG